jgi:hypothetical protein
MLTSSFFSSVGNDSQPVPFCHKHCLVHETVNYVVLAELDIKVKVSYNRLSVAQRVPGGLCSQIL